MVKSKKIKVEYSVSLATMSIEIPEFIFIK